MGAELLGAKLRKGMAARVAATSVAAPTPVVQIEPAPAPALPAPPEGLREIAGRAEAQLREALSHGGIQRDSVRLVLACHAVMTELLPAHAKELEAIMERGRRPMSPEEVAEWKAELMGAVTGPLSRIEALHGDVGQRALDGAATGVRLAAAKLVDGQRSAKVRQQAMAYVGCGVAGAVLATAVVLNAMTWRVATARAVLSLPAAEAWGEVIAANPDPRVALPDKALKTNTRTGGVYWQDVNLWKVRPQHPPDR